MKGLTGVNRRLRLAAATGVLISCCGLAAVVATGAVGSASKKWVSARAIPLGDGHVSMRPRKGYVYSCETSFRSGGAAHAGPWINFGKRIWNSKKKIAVRGAVSWHGSYTKRVARGRRVLRFNDLPTNHTTGIFPISPTDPAYRYDPNPNQIGAQQVSWSLPLHPRAAARPSCVSLGPIGVLKDGVYLFDALDAAGRDAAAHEVQDSCDGHPNRSSSYHHHDVPSCILKKTPKGTATLVGYALDGYGIYVVKNSRGRLPTNSRLDACHGTKSVVKWNGKRRKVYHYVATREYPYTVGCYHGRPISRFR